MFHRVKSVSPDGDLKLLVHFEDGTIKRYDVMPALRRWDAFAPLLSVPGLFGLVKRDPGGYGVSWNDEIDLSCDELWDNGQEVGHV